MYRPEGAEDLAVYEGADDLVEVVQVKDHSSPLAVSDFKPGSPKGFFARAKRRLVEHPNAQLGLATFGPLGPELRGAIEDGAPQRLAVINKIVGKSSEVTALDCERTLDALKGHVIQVQEATLRSQVLQALRPTIAGAHGDTAVELLLFWIFDASEQRRAITRGAVVLQLERIGAYVAALRDHSAEWHVAVRPLADEAIPPPERETLRSAYRLGVQAEWRHILADLDSVRVERLQEIRSKFTSHSVVVIRGASGQGKSSLALRYLRDYSADGLRFYVRFVDGRAHAVRIANALRDHVRSLNLQPIVLVDLGPADSGWIELIKDLATAGMSVLVAVREEDFHRAAGMVGDVSLGEVALDSVSRTGPDPFRWTG